MAEKIPNVNITNNNLLFLIRYSFLYRFDNFLLNEDEIKKYFYTLLKNIMQCDK